MSKTGNQGESTQPLSLSQVLAVESSKPPPRGIAPNDQSVAWRGTVVSADEFAPAPAKRGSRAKWAVLALIGAGGLGGGAYAMWTRGSGSPEAPATAAVVAPAAGSATGSAAGSATPVPSAAPASAAAAAAPAATSPGSAAAPAVADAGVATAPVAAAGSAASPAATATNPVAHRHVVHHKHPTTKRHHH